MAGSATALAFPFGSVFGSVATTNKPVIVTARRSSSNPLSPDEVYELQKEAAERFNRINDTDIAIGKGKPASDADTVALTHYIKPNGEPATYAGALPSAKGAAAHRIDRLHAHADEFERTIQKTTSNEPTYGFVGLASAGNMKNWDSKVANTNYEYNDCPYGVIYMSMEVKEEYDGYYYGYGGDHIHRVNPGANQCGSGWTQYETWTRDYWSEYDAGDPQLEETYPSGDRSGDFSVSGSISYGNASIGVSYNPPKVSRTDNTDDIADDYKLDWKFNSDTSSRHDFNPASQVEVSDDAESGNRILKYLSGSKWYNYNYGFHTTEADWYVYK